jgi:hypothetical protein
MIDQSRAAVVISVCQMAIHWAASLNARALEVESP